MEREGTHENGGSRDSFSKTALGIISTLLTSGVIALVVTLLVMSKDLAVIKREVEMLSSKSAEADAFRTNIDTKVNDMRLQIQRLEDRDHTEVRR